MNPAKVILATIVIFVCGLVTGVLIVKTTSQNIRSTAASDAPTPLVVSSNLPVFETNVLTQTNLAVVTRTNVVWAPFQAQRMSLIRQMVNRLHLEPDQKERISQIIKDSQERNKELWQQIAPQMRDELKRVTDEIRQELRPGQLHRFNDMLRENRRENRTSPGGAATNAVPPSDKITNEPAQSGGPN